MCINSDNHCVLTGKGNRESCRGCFHQDPDRAGRVPTAVGETLTLVPDLDLTQYCLTPTVLNVWINGWIHSVICISEGQFPKVAALSSMLKPC